MLFENHFEGNYGLNVVFLKIGLLLQAIILISAEKNLLLLTLINFLNFTTGAKQFLLYDYVDNLKRSSPS